MFVNGKKREEKNLNSPSSSSGSLDPLLMLDGRGSPSFLRSRSFFWKKSREK